MGAIFPHAVVEIVQGTDNVPGAIDGGSTLQRSISASRAFREYNWVHHRPNSAGNLRGDVA